MNESPESHRVLVVDDEPNIVDIVSMALRFQGFTVESAGNGADALAAVDAFHPDLMVLDVMLPDMEGFEVARRMGARRADVPIVFLTARDSTEDKLRGLSGGGDDYVTKPFSLEELVARIRVILRRTGRAEEQSGHLQFDDLELDEDTREVTRAGDAHRAHGDGVPAAALPDAEPAPGADPRADPRQRLGLRLRRRRPRPGDVRELPAQEGRRARPAADPHRARRRLRAEDAALVMQSLRARLVVGLLALAAVGLVLAGAITYAEQRAFLIDRIDQQARGAMPAVSRALEAQGVSDPSDPRPPGAHGPGGGAPDGDGGLGPAGADANLPPGTYAQLRDANGNVLGFTVLSYTKLPAPKLPASLAPGHLTTVGSEGGSGLRYRALALANRFGTGTTVVAIPLRDVQQTLDRLLLIEGLVIGIVLLLLGVGAWFVVTLGLRPLERMGRTAGAIAGGDMSHRVSPATEKTEIGRLGLALNAMLSRLEGAFAERQASEDQLRRFLADASHELRTPLASIRGYAELLRIGAAGDELEQQKAMRRIEDEAARMGVLVEDLLTLARLDEIREPLREDVDLAALARDAVDDARVTAPDREIEVHASGVAAVGRRSAPAAPGAREPHAQRARAHPCRDADRGVGGACGRRAASGGPRPRTRAAAGRRGSVRALLARRGRPRARPCGRRPGPRDRRRDRRGARRARGRRDGLRRRRPLHRSPSRRAA